MKQQFVKLIIFIGCIFASLGTYASGNNSFVKAKEHSTKAISNPERGFRFEIRIGNEENDFRVFYRDNWPFPKYMDQGITVTQAYCYLNKYWNSEIAQSKLDALQADFDRARKEGVKFLLRFVQFLLMFQKKK